MTSERKNGLRFILQNQCNKKGLWLSREKREEEEGGDDEWIEIDWYVARLRKGVDVKKGKLKWNRQKGRETARKEIDDLILIDPVQEIGTAAQVIIESQSLHSYSLTHAHALFFSLTSAHILHLLEERQKYSPPLLESMACKLQCS